MAYEPKYPLTVTLRLSPALHRQLVLAARKAGRPLEPTIKSLLWMGLGSLNIKALDFPRDD